MILGLAKEKTLNGIKRISNIGIRILWYEFGEKYPLWIKSLNH